MTTTWKGDRFARSARHAAQVVAGWEDERVDKGRFFRWPVDARLFASFLRVFASVTTAIGGEYDRRFIGVPAGQSWRAVAVRLAELSDADLESLRRWLNAALGVAEYGARPDCPLTLLRSLAGLEHCRRLVEPVSFPDDLRSMLDELGAGGDR